MDFDDGKKKVRVFMFNYADFAEPSSSCVGTVARTICETRAIWDSFGGRINSLKILKNLD